MIKSAITLLILAVAALAAAPVSAQTINGQWSVYPRIEKEYSNAIETPSKVYLLCGASLFHKSFDDNEFYEYSSSKLSEANGIKQIYYNYADKFLLVVYESGNLDVIKDDGKVVNMPEIKNAVLTTTRGINDVLFYDGKIYLATDFGLVVYDSKRLEVIESGIFNIACTAVFVQQGNLMLRSGKQLYYAPVDAKHNRLDAFSTMNNFNATTATHLDEEHFITVFNNNVEYWSINFQGPWFSNKTLIKGTATLSAGPEGTVIAHQSGKIHIIKPDLTFTTITLPAGASDAFTTTDEKSVWVADNGTIARYDLSSATAVLRETIDHPEGFACPEPVQMVWSNDGQRLYTTSLSSNWWYSDPGDNMGYRCPVEILENGKVREVTPLKPAVMPSESTSSGAYITSLKNLAEDPDDSDRYWVMSNGTGLLAVRDGNIEQIFNKDNVPVKKDTWLCRGFDVRFDADGNLWAGFGYVDDGTSSYFILTPDKRRGDLSKLTSADWIAVPNFFIDGTYLTRQAHSLFCKKSRYKMFFPSAPEHGIVFYDDRETPLNFADDIYVQIDNFTDTEGNILTPYYFQCAVEDENGNVWVGTDTGLFYFKPSDAFTPDFRVKRPIVPRNDGTNFGDYLLPSEAIYGLTVDHSNRKWIATGASGAYLVSPDGTKILANYTTANSGLPSDVVECVSTDPNGNRVYFGTLGGIATFNSDSAPAAEDYSDVYAYPNPVRPDYTGWITVTGLMDNSLVKIADAAGNVFFQGRSEGGMISWDGCDPSGRRVRSGIYFVFASQNDSGSASGAVTKIMVIN